MASDSSWAGWVVFAGLLMMIMGVIDFIEGLIAVIRDQYYVIHGDQVIVFDTTTWGWITMILGVLLFFVGAGLLSQRGGARWIAILLVSVALIEQLSWLGNSAYPLWALVVVALQVMVLFALTARWSSVKEAVSSSAG